MKINFDWTVTLGQIVQVLSLIVFGSIAVMKLYHTIDKRVGRFEQELLTHASTLKDHSLRMERYEAALFKVVSDLQRTIGRLEMMQIGGRWDGSERREPKSEGNRA